MKALWTLVLCAVALTGCGPSKMERLETENRELHDQVDQLQSQLSDIQEKASNLETASDELKVQLARFENEDWRDVVGDAQAAGEDVDTAKDELKQVVDE